MVSVPDGDPYSGISSTVTGIDNPGAAFLGSTSSLRAGTNGSGAATRVSMAWRNRTDIEIDGRNFDLAPSGRQYIRDGVNPGDRGIALAWDAYNVVSDVVKLDGIIGVYVLEMDYEEGELLWHNSPEPWPKHRPGDTLEEGLDLLDRIYLGWFELDDAHGVLDGYDEWVNAVEGNSAVGVSAVANYKGTYDQFAADNIVTDSNLGDYLGSFGVDTASDTVWAVLDHNSHFVTVPEPATVSLLGVGIAALLIRGRQRRGRRQVAAGRMT